MVTPYSSVQFLGLPIPNRTLSIQHPSKNFSLTNYEKQFQKGQIAELPTNGLDAETAFEIVKAASRVASAGKSTAGIINFDSG